jgi:hypothetical protein
MAYYLLLQELVVVVRVGIELPHLEDLAVADVEEEHFVGVEPVAVALGRVVVHPDGVLVVRDDVVELGALNVPSQRSTSFPK